MSDETLITLKQKGFVRQPNGTYSKISSMAPRPQGAILEFSKQHNSLGTPRNSKKSPARFRVRIIGYYVRPLDDCNFCTKYLIDCVRYSRIVTDDNWGNLRVQGEQYQVETAEEEGTEIIVEEI